MLSAPITRTKAPAFMFYPGDFLSSPDVRIMNTLEVGAYLLLLFNSWQTDQPGFLPNDENRLRLWAGLTPEQWATSRELLLSKWPVANDPAFRYNPRLVKEAYKQQANRELKSQAGKRSAAQRTSRLEYLTAFSPEASSLTESNHHSLTNCVTGSASTGVEQVFNRCSTPVQQKANLSSSISTSTPSTHRSKGEAASLAAPSRARKRLFKEPVVDEVNTYANELYPGDADALKQAAAFVDYFESNGWRVGGKTPMVNWQASFRSWMRRSPSFQGQTGSAGVNGQPVATRAQVAPRKDANLDKWS